MLGPESVVHALSAQQRNSWSGGPCLLLRGERHGGSEHRCPIRSKPGAGIMFLCCFQGLFMQLLWHVDHFWQAIHFDGSQNLTTYFSADELRRIESPQCAAIAVADEFWNQALCMIPSIEPRCIAICSQSRRFSLHLSRSRLAGCSSTVLLPHFRSRAFN